MDRASDGVGRVVEDEFQQFEDPRWTTYTTYRGDRTDIVPPVGSPPTTSIFDARGNTVAVHQYHGSAASGSADIVTYAYTAADLLESIVDEDGNEWQYTHDLRGLQLTADDPDSGLTTSTYDEAGQLKTVSDARGAPERLTHTYDALGRLVRTKNGSTTLTTFEFDGTDKGQLSKTTRHVAGGNYVTEFPSYDDAYRVLEQVVTIPAIAGQPSTPYEFETTYTIDGQIDTITQPAVGNLGPEILQYEYDDASMPDWLDAGGVGSKTGYVQGAMFTPYGELNQINLTPGYADVLGFVYESGTRRLLKAEMLREQGSTIEQGDIVDRDYTYDEAGNVTSVTNRSHGLTRDRQCYLYDYAQRLTDAWTPSADTCGTPNVSSLGGPVWFPPFRGGRFRRLPGRVRQRC